MSARDVPAGINPVMVACAIVVVSVRMKSSAVSVSSVPGLAGRDSAPSSPSGFPVLKKNGAAQAGAASHTPALTATPTTLDRNAVRTAPFISLLLSVGKSYIRAPKPVLPVAQF